jgi:hypothetical protein
MHAQMKYGSNGFEPITPMPSDEPDKKPRKDTQFKKGQSGNPKGRPKRQPVTDLRMLLDEILGEPRKIREGGRLRTVSTLHAVLLAYFDSGVRKNPRMVRRLISLAQRIGMFTRHDPSKDYPGTIFIPHQPEYEKVLRMYRAEQAALANKAGRDEGTKINGNTASENGEGR